MLILHTSVLMLSSMLFIFVGVVNTYIYIALDCTSQCVESSVLLCSGYWDCCFAELEEGW